MEASRTSEEDKRQKAIGLENEYRMPIFKNTKRLEILKDAIPRLSRVGLLRPPGTSVTGILQMKEIRPAAVSLKLKLEEIET